jgi:8-oxo-dGTP diphosphatase
VTIERAGVLIIQDGSLALIQRQVQGRRYWVIPGGGVEPGEIVADAAVREAEEELGRTVTLGALRVRIDHRAADGSIQRQWYFDASVGTDSIRIVGPETDTSDKGAYRAVWMGLDELDQVAIHPSAVAQLVARNRGVWPSTLVEIVEK